MPLLCFFWFFGFFWFLFLDPLFSVLSFRVFPWLVEEVLTLLCFFLNCENGDFLILMRDICFRPSLVLKLFCCTNAKQLAS